MRLSAAMRVHRTASHERSPPPRLWSKPRDRSLLVPIDASSSFGGTLLSRIPEMNQECPRRSAEPPAAPWVLRPHRNGARHGRSRPKEEGGVRLSAAVRPPHGEPRTEPPPRPRSRSKAPSQRGAPSAEQPKDGGSERSFPGGRSSADLRVHRKSSDEASDPPPRMRKPAVTPHNGAHRCSRPPQRMKSFKNVPVLSHGALRAARS